MNAAVEARSGWWDDHTVNRPGESGDSRHAGAVQIFLTQVTYRQIHDYGGHPSHLLLISLTAIASTGNGISHEMQLACGSLGVLRAADRYQIFAISPVNATSRNTSSYWSVHHLRTTGVLHGQLRRLRRGEHGSGVARP